MRGVRVAMAVAAGLGLAACGGDDDGGGSGGAASPRAALESLQRAAASRDGDKLCSLFTARGVSNMEENRDGQQCADQVAAGVLSHEDSLDPHASFEIRQVQAKDDAATAHVIFRGDWEAVDLKNEAGAWKIDESFP